jgi:hypothetical protein
MLIEFIFNLVQGVVHTDAVPRIHQFDQPREALVLRPGGSRCLFLALVAYDRDGLALIFCVCSVLCFALVAFAVLTTKDTRYLLDETSGPVTDDFIVINYFECAVFLCALDLYCVQHDPERQVGFDRFFTIKILAAS